MNQLFGITLGDSSGVGPEILLKAFHNREIAHPIVVYGDMETLAFYDRRLGYGVPMRSICDPVDYKDGVLNVLDRGILRQCDITPGKINAKSGHAAREYVVAAAKAALAGEIAAMVTLPMNKEATQLTDP